MENDQGAPGMCDDCKGAGGWASNELCETCNGTGRQTALVQRVPDGYAYRYPDGYIRHNDGREVNGSKPTEVLPWFYSTTVADMVAELTTKLTAERTGQQPAQPESGENPMYSLVAEGHEYAGHLVAEGIGGHSIVSDLTNEVSRLQSALAAAQQRIADGLEAWKANNAHFAARIAELREALRTYGWHKPECDYMQEELPCTCGFLTAVERDFPEEQGNG